jgi:pimeloyl-ACP methyl ester carboxylesterase
MSAKRDTTALFVGSRTQSSRRRTMFRGHDRSERAREALTLHLTLYQVAGGGAAFAAQVRSLDVRDTLDIAQRLPRLNVPASIIWGTADRFQKVAYGVASRTNRARTTTSPSGPARVTEPTRSPSTVAATGLCRMLGVAPRSSRGGSWLRLDD